MTYEEVLLNIAKGIGGEKCVGPTPDELEGMGRWFVTDKHTEDALNRLLAALPDVETSHYAHYEWGLGALHSDADDGETPELMRRAKTRLVFIMSPKQDGGQERYVSLDNAHAAWLFACDERERDDIPHPLTPLVEAWLKRPTQVVPFTPRRRASLPRLANVTDAEAEEAMTLLLPSSDEQQLTLPGIPEPIKGYPSWLLNAFEHLVGDIKWRRAPLSLRLFVAVLLRLRNADRDGKWHTMEFPVLQRNVKFPAEESLESMLYGEKGWTNWRSKDHQDGLLRALHKLHRTDATRLTRPDREGGSEFFDVSGFDGEKGAPFVEGVVEFSVRVPRSAAHGDRIDWEALQGYGLKSRPLYCGYLSACAVIGAAAHHGHGQTAEIGKHLVGKDGKALYHKDKPKRDNTALVPNELGKRLVRPHTKRDLARFCAMNPNIGADRSRAVGHFEQLDDDGHIDLRRDGDMWRIFAPRNPPI